MILSYYAGLFKLKNAQLWTQTTYSTTYATSQSDQTFWCHPIG